MNNSYLEVSNLHTGWSRQQSLGEALVYIGSQLEEGDGIPLPEATALGEYGRLLVRPLGEGQFGYVLHNLSDVSLSFQPYPERPENPARMLRNGDEVLLNHQDRVVFGGYQLVYCVGHALTELTLRVNFDGNRTRLALDQPLSGALLIQSKTNQPLQPVVDMILGERREALSGEHVSNPEAGIPVPFRLVHPRATTPPPGPYPLVFEVRAPNAFPGKLAIRTQVIEIDPYPQHHVHLHPNTLTTRRPGWMQTSFYRVRKFFTNRFDFFRFRTRRSG